jgi:hypothetical protein
VGSVKRCKNPKCNRVFYPDWNEKNVVYCQDCRKNRIDQDTYRMKHEKAQIGNSKQDAEILRFLRNKRKKEDNRYD